ncbi:protein of unknown function [Xenorhabdus poinarii G6]|uniref:Uncharacterized protein n=1 Tax=Xenorhabdus poinarii G6 TaxID=1354304 RepID=A0A068R303_9GAMM|nr:hypothetical protein [Xenorhabdus poinarii]CDG21414.1 protein of unknown function [Xenorhabdus poinarii G6]
MTTQERSAYSYTSINKFMKNYDVGKHYKYKINDNFETIENKNGEVEVFFQDINDNKSLLSLSGVML